MSGSVRKKLPQRTAKPKDVAAGDGGDATTGDGGGAAPSDEGTQHRLQRQLDTLHKEMEVAQSYGTDATGHNLTKRLSVRERRHKRRTRQELEEQDLLEQETQSSASASIPSKKRLRGSKASLRDEVIAGSLVIPPPRYSFRPKRKLQQGDSVYVDPDGEDGSDDDVLDNGEEIGDAKDDGPSNEDEDGDGEEALAESDVTEEDEDDDEEDDADSDDNLPSGRSGAQKGKVVRDSGASSNLRRPRKKATYRLRDFKSARLAKQHGDALDAHLRGRHLEAMHILKQIAREAPSAPQVYSSLGMVYCDMLREVTERLQRIGGGAFLEESNDTGGSASSGRRKTETDFGGLRAEQLDLAKKAYGAYHVAALLCKKDFQLWVRAADLASEIADLHSSALTLPGLSETGREHHITERQRWLTDAKSDYQSADNLRPPGIDVPAKLATVLIELGELSEALTLLTDVKNSVSDRISSDFVSSYRAWWLFADLMLRIGAECDQWNSGKHDNKNYMFRRWLKKHSKTFDWKVRRLQALIKALEAAAGSAACIPLINWLQSRRLASSDRDSTELDPNEEHFYGDERHSASLLPMCASFESIIAIATDLMRLSLSMGFYECGVHAGNSITSYMKMRVALHDKRTGKFREEQETRTLLVNDERMGESDSEESQIPFSDDEDLENDGYLLERMRKGVLPPEISILLGCCLAGNGDKNFIAFKHMESISLLPQDTVRRFTCDCCKRELGGEEQFGATTSLPSPMDPSCRMSVWEATERNFDSRTAAYTLVADCLRNLGKLKLFSSWLAPLFSTQADFLITDGVVDEALQGAVGTECAVVNAERTKIIKHIFVTAEMFLNCTEQSVAAMKEKEAASHIEGATRLVDYLIQKLWLVRPDKSLADDVVELLKTIRRLAGLALTLANLSRGMVINDVFRFFEKVVSLFSRLDGDTMWKTSRHITSQTLFSASWMSELHACIASCTFNLAVALNVSGFSGWEEEDFNLTLIRRKSRDSHFGISVVDSFVFGRLGSELEDRLSLLWDIVVSLIPDVRFDYRGKLARRHHDGSPSESAGVNHNERNAAVSQYGETSALYIIVDFARMCLLRARDEKDGNRRGLIAIALSILLPLSQFCLSEKLWKDDMKIGRIFNTDLEIYQQQAESNFEGTSDIQLAVVAPSKQAGYVPRNRRPQNDTLSDSASIICRDDELVSQTNRVFVSCSDLMLEWNRGSSWLPGGQTDVRCKMEKLSACLHDLRSCQTDSGVEKASLKVASALIDTAMSAENPFLVLEHAARFASMSPKLGSSDRAFQAPLPDSSTCTAIEALVILGRADCLQAVFFCAEAAFLVDFVASLCRIHRNDSDFTSCQQWKIVSIKAYNVYLTITSTLTKVMREKEIKPEFKVTWQKCSMEEISLGRLSALALTVKAHQNTMAIGPDNYVSDEREPILTVEL